MSRWESLRSCLRHRDPGHRDPEEEMLQMELSNLKFRFGRIDESKLASDVKKKLNDLFEKKPAPTWDDAYQIENQIAMLLTGDCLHQQIKYRLREALARNATDAAVLQTDYDDLVKSNEKEGRTSFDDDLHYFLLEVLENINWQKKLKYLARWNRLQATRKTLWIVAGALVLVLWPYFFWLPACIWAHFGLYTALTFGLLGALFSRLYNLERSGSKLTLEELRHAQTFGYILQRACIGACGALIVYFFLQSELVTSVVSPVFEKLGEDVKSVRDGQVSHISNLARLIIWSFIAGFSESLVPSVLSKTEGQFGGAVSAGPAKGPSRNK